MLKLTKTSLAKLLLPPAFIFAAALMLIPARVGAGSEAPASITLTSPNNVTVAESDDYATQVLGNPWDMDDPDDIDFPYKYNLPQLANGLWSAATNSSTDAHVMLQYQSYEGIYSYLGEADGVNRPVDTSRFTRLWMRVNVQQAGQGVMWWVRQPHTYAPTGNTRFIEYQTGWHIYQVDLPAGGPASGGNWTNEGSVAGMRLDAPWNTNNNTVQYDWIRLTPPTGSNVNIAWTHTSTSNPNVNLYLSTSPDANVGNEYLIATVPADSLSYSWRTTGMAPGTYWIHAEMEGSWRSSGPLNVNTAPLLKIDAPGPRSGEDFAYAVKGSGWTDASQFKRVTNVGNLVTTPEYVQANATNNDPQVYWLVTDDNTRIDTSRYRYVNFDYYLQAPTQRPTSPWNAGPRMLWSGTNPIVWDHSHAILAHYNQWMPLTWDMPSLPLVANPAGWTGQINTLRFDPHEQDDANNGSPVLPAFFRMKNASLTSMPVSGPATLIRWRKLQGGGTVDLYRDSDNSGFNGTLIASGVSLDAGSYAWDTSALSNGTYWVYAVARDGYNTSRWYSLTPLLVDHSSQSTIFSDVPTQYWAAEFINDLGTRGIIAGYAQNDNRLLFRPANTATRAQLSKMVVLGAGWQLVSPASATFADVSPSNTLYPFIETAAEHGVISGYQCGSAGEPCGAGNKPYFRPGNNVTRAQTAKMISVSRGWQVVTPSDPTFEDVPASSALYGYVETAAQRGILGGYNCGGANEPCGAGSKPYFRPGLNVTRAQLSKMLSSALDGPQAGSK
jgi:hypothetical protein